MKFVSLQCDYMNNPLGFDFDRPMLHWVVEAGGRNRTQSAYRIQVARDAAFTAPDFDTGRVTSDESLGFRLPMALEACTRYYWRVNVWDDAGEETGFSSPAWFETGRYSRPWRADWIGYDEDFPQLRRGFTVDRPVKRARAYASGVGLYRLFLNGAPASDELLTPGFTAYDQWIQYQTYDVTDRLRPGLNVVGAWLGNGYYKGRVNWPDVPERHCIYGDELGFILELEIEYADGTRQTILTDESWEAMRSPYLRAEIYDGEVFDARLWDVRWCEKVGGGAPVKRAHIDKALLQARRGQPVRVMRALPVAQKLITPAGEQVLDFGQNIAGLLRVTIDAPRDTEIHFQFGESLEEHGNFYRDNMRTALEELRYICDGERREYAASFTFHGFRYVKVTGWDIPAENAVAEVIYTDMPTTGAFECSDARVNRLFQNALWSQYGNFIDIPTDCPQRDERMGWTGDAQVFCPTACMNMQSDAFYRKYLYDLRLEQKKMGFVPVVVPFILRGSGVWEAPATAWSDAAVLMPWALYLYYGDRPALEAQYDSMKDWVDTMTGQDEGRSFVFEGQHLGDWLAQDTKNPDNRFGMTPTSLVAMAYYAWSAAHVAKAARVLGRDGDAAKYEALSEKVKAWFRHEFVAESGRVTTETQTAYLLALRMDLLKPEQREKAIQCLAYRLEFDGLQLTTGFVGTPCLCPVLSETGLNEYAYTLLLQTKCPSWLYEVEMGATTMWERWNSIRPDRTMGAVIMNSLNHYSFGAISEWLYRYVAGINPDEQEPGFRRAVIRPRISDLLQYATGAIDTVHGRYASGWKLQGSEVQVDVEVPFNGRARVILPDSRGARIAVNGQAAAPDGEADGCAAFECGSGRWSFRYTASGETLFRRPGEFHAVE